MIDRLKKSLRVKLTLILFLVGVLPLGCVSVFFFYTSRDALFENVFKELRWNVDEVSYFIESYFVDTARDLLSASHNAAFRMYFVDSENRERWIKEQHKALKYLKSVYPDMLDEACYIEASGQEISRIVHRDLAGEDELSSEEDRSIFFREAFKLSDGEVYQGRPVISEDTKRWVVPNATPIVIDGKKAAILHFEITVTYFQKLLKRSVNPSRGYGFILDGSGRFIAHTQMEFGDDAPFPEAVGAGSADSFKSVIKKMMSGESGIERFEDNGEDYFVIFRPIGTGYSRGVNENTWSIAYAIPSRRIYVELDILRYNILAFGATVLLVVLLAYLAGNHVTRPIRELAVATRKIAKGGEAKVVLQRVDELGELSSSFNEMQEAIRKRDEELRRLAVTDGLTGLYNHAFFIMELDRVLKGAKRYGREFSVIMADVDFFKIYNDTYGHVMGDQALMEVAGAFASCVRNVDTVARYGGEEFAVVLPETPMEGALSVAERIRREVLSKNIGFKGATEAGVVTVSFGVASFPRQGPDVDSLIDGADRALYAAKNLGRNRVAAAGDYDAGRD